ncbi:MAG: arsenite methyltransferase [Parabacteroides sp.]|nr:arsenite methyltransferase [Parabacteroides sp.]
MKNKQKIKDLVKEKYGEITLADKSFSCCNSGCCSPGNAGGMSESYTMLEGYNPDADFALGCGLPTEYAGIKKGDTVLDMGSGAGNDCFVARALTGETGKVIGIDFTPAMVDKANENAEKAGFRNVSFRKGDIENMPVGGNSVDVVISNCVLNLLPAKNKIFREIFRVLKPGGRFCISDIVLEGELPKELAEASEMYTGCIAGAIQKKYYMIEIFSAGFQHVKIEKQKPVLLPDEVLEKYLEGDTLTEFKTGKTGIFSITVTGLKPACDCNCE